MPAHHTLGVNRTYDSAWPPVVTKTRKPATATDRVPPTANLPNEYCYSTFPIQHANWN